MTPKDSKKALCGAGVAPVRRGGGPTQNCVVPEAREALSSVFLAAQNRLCGSRGKLPVWLASRGSPTNPICHKSASSPYAEGSSLGLDPRALDLLSWDLGGRRRVFTSLCVGGALGCAFLPPLHTLPWLSPCNVPLFAIICPGEESKDCAWHLAQNDLKSSTTLNPTDKGYCTQRFGSSQKEEGESAK